ncbi:MAG: hydrogenase expression/formation protein HypE [Candidatus Marsarchaeota archaeon]|nr:hydrogenase expression/formation protein HypE [Candidatus Marsarchaeota archaeon]
MITLAHGAGGKTTEDLIKKIIMPKFKIRNVNALGLDALDDGSAIKSGKTFFVFTSDSYIVKPLFFKGGDIGKLAVVGVANDLSVMGAKPIAMHLNLILEEGLDSSVFEKILSSIGKTAEEQGIAILGGDTKVMEKGKIDQIAISAFGIGVTSKLLTDADVKPGDDIIVSGGVGEHEASILIERENIGVSKIKSDCAPLQDMVEKILKIGGVHAMKDLTRGGLTMALNEWSEKSKIGLNIFEKTIPVSKTVKSMCRIYGFDPFNLACEGRMIIAVESSKTRIVLKTLKKTKLGKNASVIGKAVEGGEVVLNTSVGGRKLLTPFEGVMLPRIC